MYMELSEKLCTLGLSPIQILMLRAEDTDELESMIQRSGVFKDARVLYDLWKRLRETASRSRQRREMEVYFNWKILDAIKGELEQWLLRDDVLDDLRSKYYPIWKFSGQTLKRKVEERMIPNLKNEDTTTLRELKENAILDRTRQAAEEALATKQEGLHDHLSI